MTSADTLSGHADLIDLLAAMFPLPGEFRIDPPSEADVAWLRDVVNGGAERKDSTRLSQPIKAFLRVSEDDSPDHAVELEVQLWLEQTRPIIAVRRAEHLTRTEQRALEMELLTGEAEEAADVILAHVDRVRGFLLQHRTRADAARAAPLAIPEPAAPDERIWFWFPSLSTRAKRQDLVDYALRYGLTGFVLAGKPGLLCLEGAPRSVNEYMSAIKSESWSDIPSYQKKVTERHRERIAKRAFPDMREITDSITQYGRFGNRGEMGEVKAFLDAHGVGDALGIVLGTGGG